jgi:hypothetical protein
MPFSEDDLRQALRREDPGPEFTRKVLARVKERDAGNKGTSPRKRRVTFFWLPRLRFAPALSFAVALVIAIGAWVGYASYQQHERAAKAAKHQQELEAERAKEKTILALRITSEKLNHVLRKVNGALPPDVKIRRERL